MKNIILMLSVLCFCLAANAQQQFVVDPNAEMRPIAADFNSIEVSGGIDLYLSQSVEVALAVSASEEKYLVGIKTVVENNVLKIYYEGEKHWNKKSRELTVYVSFKVLQQLEASGASDIVVAGELNSPELRLKLSAASDFIGRVNSNTLTLNLSGASVVNMSGSASIVNIVSSGASDVKAFDLSAGICRAQASGASDINITVNKELNANASGASNIYYRGGALLKESQSSGASTVARKD